AVALAFDPPYALLLEELIRRGLEARLASTALLNDFRAAAVEADVVLRNADGVVTLIEAKSSLPREVYREAVEASADSRFDVTAYLARAVESDVEALEPVVNAVLAENPQQVETFRGGKEGVLGFLVGQVMKETSG